MALKEQEKEQEQLYSISNIVNLSGICRTKIYEEINTGRLPAKKMGRRTLIPKSKYKGWIDNLPDYPKEDDGKSTWVPPKSATEPNSCIEERELNHEKK
jgi:excisionase family DNA binding protein